MNLNPLSSWHLDDPPCPSQHLHHSYSWTFEWSSDSSLFTNRYTCLLHCHHKELIFSVGISSPVHYSQKFTLQASACNHGRNFTKNFQFIQFILLVTLPLWLFYMWLRRNIALATAFFPGSCQPPMQPNRLLKFTCPLHEQGCSKRFRSQAGHTYHICTCHTNHNIVTPPRSSPSCETPEPLSPLPHDGLNLDIPIQDQDPSCTCHFHHLQCILHNAQHLQLNPRGITTFGWRVSRVFLMTHYPQSFDFYSLL